MASIFADHIRQLLEGVDFEEFFEEEQEAAPRKRTCGPSAHCVQGRVVPLRQFKEPAATPLVRQQCVVHGAGGIDFNLEFVPVNNGRAAQIKGDTVKLREWIKKQFVARWNRESGCWVVQLGNGLTFESLIFRVKYCASRSWNNVPLHKENYFVKRNMKVPSYMCDPDRAYDEAEAAKTKANLDLFLEKTRTSRLPPAFDKGLCHYCGHDLFYFSCPDFLPERCPGCGKQ